MARHLLRSPQHLVKVVQVVLLLQKKDHYLRLLADF